LLAAFIATIVFLFLKLGSEVVNSETQDFDNRMLLFAQGLRARHPTLAEIMRDLTARVAEPF
jgi:undecaprenyl-diphosphatase